MEAEEYPTIREIVGGLIGAKIVDITQQDKDYFLEHGIGFIDLMFDSGDVLRIWSLRGDESLLTLNPDSETPEDIERM